MVEGESPARFADAESPRLFLILVFSLRVKIQILVDRATARPLLGGVALESLTCAGSLG